MEGKNKYQEISESNCLNSWKVIASYLGRSVRTVRRWEEQEGLPVHRHRHDRGSTVYAYKSELDLWLQRRQYAEISDPLGAEPEVKRHYSYIVSITVTILFIAISITAGLYYIDEKYSQQSESVTEQSLKGVNKQSWVLVTRINNQTDKQVFDEPFKHVLKQAVCNTRFADLASEKHTSAILNLMRMPPDTEIDRSLGQEIALRDSRIQAVLAGRVDQFDRDILISVDLISPVRGLAIASLSEQIAIGAPILPAVHRLSVRVGEKIDEMLPQIKGDSLALSEVTTSSIAALQKFSLAEALMEDDHLSAAIELLQQAVQEDPAFATAHAQLAWALYKQGRPEDEYQAQQEQAMRYYSDVSDKERYYISASYHHMTGDLQKAQALYETLLRLEPDHFWANKYAFKLCQRIHSRLSCSEYIMRLAEMRPSSFDWSYKAAWFLVGQAGDAQAARPFNTRAVNNLSAIVYRKDPHAAVKTELFDVYRQWTLGELPQVLEVSNRIAEMYGSRPSVIRDLFYRELGLVSLASGLLEKAEMLFNSISDHKIRHEMLARVLFSRWDDEALKRHLAKGAFYQDPITAILLTKVGLHDMAETLIEDLSRRGVLPAQQKIIKGKLALDRGRQQEAITLLRGGLDELDLPAHGLFFAGADSLAGAWLMGGDAGNAVRVLQRTSNRRNQAAFSGTADLWMRCQLRLAQIYKSMGRETDAAEIKTKVIHLLAHADANHPLLDKLHRL